MKIALYLDNKNYENIDLREIEKGNPGIGGTDYSFFSLEYYLKIYKKTSYDLDVILYLRNEVILPLDVKCKVVKDVINAIEEAAKDKVEIFIFRPCRDDDIICEKLEENYINGIAWISNDFYPCERKKITNSFSIKRIVCLGHEQLDMFRDHQAFYKTCIINYALNTKGISNYSNIKKQNIVAYTGALIDLKGFHVLAKIWKSILKKVPDAELWVFGTGQLYDSNAKLGKWKIADEEYEKTWRPYLSDIDGNMLESVRFMGKVGIEKFELYRNVKVGVVNPTGKTETFCLCGVEYGICGIPVVSARKNGLLDTIIHKQTGLLIKNKIQLVKYIVRLLKDDKLNSELGTNARKFIKENFEWEFIIPKWVQLFDDIKNSKPCIPEKIKSHWFSNLKFIREINRQVKKIKLFKNLPCLLEFRVSITYPYRKFFKNEK